MDRFFALLMLLFLSGCRSISYEEKDLSGIFRQIETLNEQGKYTDVISLIKAHNPYAHLDLLEALAFAYEANGQFLLAAQTFEQLFFADTEKKYTESIFYAAQIYTQLDCLYAAGRCYRSYIDIHFKNADLWFALAEIEDALEHTALALTAYLNGVQYCKTKTSDILYRIASLCYKNQMWDEAAFWAQEYLKFFGNNVDVLQMLLNVADKHNDRQQARTYIFELQKIDGEYLEKNPSMKLKYMDEEIKEEKIEEEVFVHDINSTKEEIEATLNYLHRFLKSETDQKPTNLFNYLCPFCTY